MHGGKALHFAGQKGPVGSWAGRHSSDLLPPEDARRKETFHKCTLKCTHGNSNAEAVSSLLKASNFSAILIASIRYFFSTPLRSKFLNANCSSHAFLSF